MMMVNNDDNVVGDGVGGVMVMVMVNDDDGER